MDDAIQLVLETFPCWISGASTDTKPMVGADAKACRIHGNGNKSHGSADHQQVLNGCQPARAIDAALRSAAQICFLTAVTVCVAATWQAAKPPEQPCQKLRHPAHGCTRLQTSATLNRTWRKYLCLSTAQLHNFLPRQKQQEMDQLEV